MRSSESVYHWKVKKVIDGDTIEVASDFLPPELKLSVRVRNLDTPEKYPRAKCSQENRLAQKASEFTQKTIQTAEKNGQEITFSELKWDKYGGRVLAEVRINNQSLADGLIRRGLAREYHGKKKSAWCNF